MMEMLMGMLEALGEDVLFSVSSDGSEVHVDLQDFAGFDSHWCEVERDYDHPEEVEAFEDWLEASCVTSSGDYYREYEFEGFVVVLGYASMDI